MSFRCSFGCLFPRRSLWLLFLRRHYGVALGLLLLSRHRLHGVASHHFALALAIRRVMAYVASRRIMLYLLLRYRCVMAHAASRRIMLLCLPRRLRDGLHGVPSHDFAATIVVIAVDNGDMATSILFICL